MGACADVQEKRTLYERLHVSAEDFSSAKQYAQHLIKKGWHSAPYERRGSIYMQQSAFTTALIVSYARPFTKGKGWPKFPEKLVQYHEEAKQLHQKILDLRHQVYAHSDSSHYSIRPFQIDTDFFVDIVGAPFLKLTQSECEILIAMINSILDRLLPRIAELRKELVCENET